MTPSSRLMKSAACAMAGAWLAGGLLAACGSSNSVPLSIAGLDKRVDPTRAPQPGEKVPLPATVPDPSDLSGKIGLPKGSTGQITFYFSLPIDDYTLREAAKVVTTPGTGGYRHFFTSYTDAARTYGAKPAVIEAAIRSVEAKGLSVMVDPSRTFVRVWATAGRWRKVLGQPLTVQPGTPSAPFNVYDLPTVPTFDNLTYVGGGATVYASVIDNGSGGYGASVQNAAMIDRARASASSSPSISHKIPWPLNEGTPPAHTCVSGTSTARTVYAPNQVGTAYDTSALHETAATKAVRVSVIDLGGGYVDADIRDAAACFGYVPPTIQVEMATVSVGRSGTTATRASLICRRSPPSRRAAGSS